MASVKSYYNIGEGIIYGLYVPAYSIKRTI